MHVMRILPVSLAALTIATPCAADNMPHIQSIAALVSGTSYASVGGYSASLTVSVTGDDGEPVKLFDDQYPTPPAQGAFSVRAGFDISVRLCGVVGSLPYSCERVHLSKLSIQPQPGYPGIYDISGHFGPSRFDESQLTDGKTPHLFVVRAFITQLVPTGVGQPLTLKVVSAAQTIAAYPTRTL